MSRDLDDEFNEWKHKAREWDIIDAATRAGLKLKKAGRDYNGPCPSCNSVDSFVITPKNPDPAKRFVCRKGGAGGDAIAAVMHAMSCDFLEAVEKITGEPPPKGQSKPTDPEVIRDRQEKRRDDRRDVEREERRQRDWKTETAASVWALAQSIKGTHAEAYLKARGITITEEDAQHLGFIPALDYRGYRDENDDDGGVLATGPCLVARIQNVDGELIGVHRTYLDPLKPRKFSPPGDPKRNKAKKVFGFHKTGSTRLTEYLTDTVAMGEGIETTRSWYALGAGAEDVSLLSALNLPNLGGGSTGTQPHPTKPRATIPNGVPDLAQPGVILPPEVTTVILLVDGDSDAAYTFAQMLAAGRRYKAEGREVFYSIAPDGHDWSDIHLNQIDGKPIDQPTIITLKEFEQRAQAVMTPLFKSKFGAMFLDDLDKPGPEHEYLINSFMTVGDKSIIGGPSQSGKSFLAIHAGMCVATGREFFGQSVKQGLVIYQAGEGARGVKKRLRAWRQHFGVNFGRDTPFVLLQSAVDLYRPDGDTSALIAEINLVRKMYEVPLRLVVIDTLATATAGADENSGKDMGQVMANIGRIHQETGAHVCLVHHMNAAGSKLRGHTSIYANVDQVALVTRDEVTKHRTVRLDKQKDDANDIKFGFMLLSVEVGYYEDGRPITSCVVVSREDKERVMGERARRGVSLNQTNMLIFRALLKALDEFGTNAPYALGLPLGTQAVDAKKWTEAYSRVSTHDIGDEAAGEDEATKREAAIKKRLQRAAEYMLNAGLIGRDGAWIWWTGKPVAGLPETFERSGAGGVSRAKDAPTEKVDDNISGLL